MRIVAHLDMDAFFAACEERANPQFAGLGIVVGADPKNGIGRGVVSTANYQARKYGIHSAMPISIAWRLAKSAERRGQPKTVFLPVNGAFYSQVSDKIMGIVRKYVEVVEQTSIDEAYLDLSSSFPQTPQIPHIPQIVQAEILIKKIKQDIKDQERLTASVGIGPNKLIAKMASGRDKPDGLTVIYPELVEGFLGPLPIGDIPGIGPKTEEFFHKKNIYKVADLKKISKEELKNWIGKWGEDIWEKVRGIDNSPLTLGREIKSISEQETFEKDTTSAAFILGRLDKLVTRVIERMKEEEISKFKTVTIIVRFADFTTKNRSHTLKTSTDSLKVLKNEAIKLLLPFLDRRQNPSLKKIRLIGVGIENFAEEKKQQIETPEKETAVQENLFT